jgi:hypothetical protein
LHSFLFSVDFFKKLDDEGNGTVQARSLLSSSTTLFSTHRFAD